MSTEELQGRLERCGQLWIAGQLTNDEFQDLYMAIVQKVAIPPLTLELVEEQRLAWSRATFPDSTPFSSLRHLEREIHEIEVDIVSGVDPTEEYADALACLLDSAGRAGVTVPNLLQAMLRKLEVNKQRTWTRNDDGSYSHVKTSTDGPATTSI